MCKHKKIPIFESIFVHISLEELPIALLEQLDQLQGMKRNNATTDKQRTIENTNETFLSNVIPAKSPDTWFF